MCRKDVAPLPEEEEEEEAEVDEDDPALKRIREAARKAAGQLQDAAIPRDRGSGAADPQSKPKKKDSSSASPTPPPQQQLLEAVKVSMRRPKGSPAAAAPEPSQAENNESRGGDKKTSAAKGEKSKKPVEAVEAPAAVAPKGKKPQLASVAEDEKVTRGGLSAGGVVEQRALGSSHGPVNSPRDERGGHMVGGREDNHFVPLPRQRLLRPRGCSPTKLRVCNRSFR